MDKKFTSSAFSQLPPLPGKNHQKKKKQEEEKKDKNHKNKDQKTGGSKRPKSSLSRKPKASDLAWYSRFRPARTFAALAILFVASFGLNMAFEDDYISYGDSSAFEMGNMNSPIHLDGNEVDLDLVSRWVNDNSAYLTWRAAKNDPYDYLNGTIHVEAYYGDNSIDWNYSSFEAGYGIDEVYFTLPVNIQSYDPDSISLNVDLSEYGGITLDDQYLGEDIDPSMEGRLQAYQEQNPQQNRTAVILTDDQASESHRITYQIQNPAGYIGPVKGYANIRFIKDGQVVYSQVVDYHYSNDVESAQFSYQPPVQIPEYDTVEIVDLHTY